MKVLWLTNVPSPYRVAFFNELGKTCELTVAFEKRCSDERDASWLEYSFEHFEGVFLHGLNRTVDTAFCPSVVKLLSSKKYHYVVVTNFSDPTGIVAVYYMKLIGMPYVIESDGGMPKNGKGLRERMKKTILSDAQSYYSTSAVHDTYYLAYGAMKERIKRYPFTSLYESDVFDTLPTAKEKQALREKLGMTEAKIVLSVGRFSYLNGYGKGYDVLLMAASSMEEDIGWYIVGGEVTDEFRKLTEQFGVKNVHYIPHMPKDALKEYYRAADVFVLMSVSEAWGLVINEAMACGLPVITTDKCVAGVELVENGVNGYIVPVGDDNLLIDSIKAVFQNNENGQMGLASLAKIKPYTIENMARVHFRDFSEGLHHE